MVACDLWHDEWVTFNNNLGNYSNRGSTGDSGGGGGGFNLGGGGGGGRNNLLFTLLFSTIGRRFGIPGLIVVGIAMFIFSGGMGSLTGNNSSHQAGVGNHQGGTQVGQGADFSHCKTAEDANNNDDCRLLATGVSLDQFWSQALPQEAGIQYTEPKLVIAEGQVSTGCGTSNISQTGPFYCPNGQTVYMSVPFFDQLRQMGGSDGAFSQMYVTAHEFGHHIQNLQNTLGLSDYNNPGADSNAVKLELQADCYAGLWATHADKGSNALLEPLTQTQVEQAVTTAKSIGDDAIQSSSGQEVNPDQWTHGSSEQRVEWFTRGYQGGTMQSCAQDFNR
ncbi:MAG TPA: neutral zinc metallopeptidase [Candidatus Corynebacterium gallistercoris]|uniref:Neutral zinc metallopeptidase n=1 Tax=Candidatus Corynebacterium gallistercoris TaxID=2838530 RepID=A0A9D1RZN8_9CORY|nr:neutral zinc metallopeptidase [Candidatus Corynebacterium gallistercoris]